MAIRENIMDMGHITLYQNISRQSNLPPTVTHRYAELSNANVSLYIIQKQTHSFVVGIYGNVRSPSYAPIAKVKHGKNTQISFEWVLSHHPM